MVAFWGAIERIHTTNTSTHLHSFNGSSSRPLLSIPSPKVLWVMGDQWEGVAHPSMGIGASMGMMFHVRMFQLVSTRHLRLSILLPPQ